MKSHFSLVAAGAAIMCSALENGALAHSQGSFSTISPWPSQLCDFSSQNGVDVVVFGDSLSDYHNNWNQDKTPQSPPWNQHYSNAEVWPQHAQALLGLEKIYAAPTNGTGPEGKDWRGNSTFTYLQFLENESAVYDYAYGGATSSSGGEDTPRFLFAPGTETPDVPGAYQQVGQYVQDVKAAGRASGHNPGESVHVVWAGINDFWRLVPIVVNMQFSTPLAGGANLLTFPDEMAKVAAMTVKKLILEGGARTVIVPLFFGADQIPEGKVLSNGNPTVLAAAGAVMAAASSAVNASLSRLSETLPVDATIHTVDVKALYGNRTTLAENYGITNFDKPCVRQDNATGNWSFTNGPSFCNVSFSMEGVHPTGGMTKFLGDAFSSVICKAKEEKKRRL